MYLIAILALVSFLVGVVMFQDYKTMGDHYYPQVGDYWVIYLLSKNLNPIAMKELLEELKPVENTKLVLMSLTVVCLKSPMVQNPTSP